MNYVVAHDGEDLGEFPTFMDADLFVRPLAWAEKDDPLRTPFIFMTLPDRKVIARVLVGHHLNPTD